MASNHEDDSFFAEATWTHGDVGNETTPALDDAARLDISVRVDDGDTDNAIEPDDTSNLHGAGRNDDAVHLENAVAVDRAVALDNAVPANDFVPLVDMIHRQGPVPIDCVSLSSGSDSTGSSQDSADLDFILRVIQNNDGGLIGGEDIPASAERGPEIVPAFASPVSDPGAQQQQIDQLYPLADPTILHRGSARHFAITVLAEVVRMNLHQALRELREHEAIYRSKPKPKPKSAPTNARRPPKYCTSQLEAHTRHKLSTPSPAFTKGLHLGQQHGQGYNAALPMAKKARKLAPFAVKPVRIPPRAPKGMVKR